MNAIKKIAALFLTAIMLSMMSPTTFAAEIDWEKGTIRAEGKGYGPKNADPKSSFYKTYARQAARLDALRNIYLMIKGVTIDEEAILSLLLDPEPFSEVQCYHVSFQRAWQVGESKFNEDGICEVMMALPIFK